MPTENPQTQTYKLRLAAGESAGAILGHTTPRERRGAAEKK